MSGKVCYREAETTELVSHKPSSGMRSTGDSCFCIIGSQPNSDDFGQSLNLLSFNFSISKMGGISSSQEQRLRMKLNMNTKY